MRNGPKLLYYKTSERINITFRSPWSMTEGCSVEIQCRCFTAVVGFFQLKLELLKYFLAFIELIDLFRATLVVWQNRRDRDIQNCNDVRIPVNPTLTYTLPSMRLG